MNANDDRHGTSAGYIAGCRETCCWRAKQRYDKTRRLELLTTGERRIVPTWRALRRIQALQALGWSVPQIAVQVGLNHRHLYSLARHPTIYRSTFDAIDAAYQRMCMTRPVPRTTGERSGVTKAKRYAERNGFPPPLAWDDIDDPDETPGAPKADHSYVDEAVVLRVLTGDARQASKATPAERAEVVRRWRADGRPLNDLERLTGWQSRRYIDKEAS
jgi:hypothetical protein